jgi:signal transduction histidine kinase
MVANYDQWEGSAPGYVIPIGRILGVPLTYGARTLGALTVYDIDVVGEFSTEEVNLLRLFAALASSAVYNATLYEEVRTSRARLQDLSRRLVEVQEAERRYLARELHDEIGQVLTGLTLMLDSIQQTPDEAENLLGEAQELIGKLSDQISDLSLDLRPAMLDDLGLLPALVWHLGRFENQTSIQINFEHKGLDRRFDLEVETAAYRIVQEGLTNVARHAGVGQVEVRLWTDPERLFIQIEDQGVGFSADQVWFSPTASGLAGMQERAEVLGGALEISSTLGAGTTLLSSLPINPNSEGVQA